MAGIGEGDERAVERGMALLHAPAATRPALAALLALDDSLGRVPRTTREPMIGRIRLAWWREALTALDAGPPPAEPVLAALTAEVVARGTTGAALAAMVDGWEALLDEPLDAAAVSRFAGARGAGLFRVAAAILGATGDAIDAAGEGWALADLAGHVGDAAVARRAGTMAGERFAAAFARRWPRAARPLGAIALLARADLAGVPPGSPRRAGRLVVHRLTGR